LGHSTWVFKVPLEVAEPAWQYDTYNKIWEVMAQDHQLESRITSLGVKVCVCWMDLGPGLQWSSWVGLIRLCGYFAGCSVSTFKLRCPATSRSSKSLAHTLSQSWHTLRLCQATWHSVCQF
jgi:hypothetical protein